MAINVKNSSELELVIEDLKTRISTLEANLNTLESDLNTLETNLNALESRVTTLESGFDDDTHFMTDEGGGLYRVTIENGKITNIA